MANITGDTVIEISAEFTALLAECYENPDDGRCPIIERLER